MSFCETSIRREMLLQNVIYVILKVWNGRLILDENISFLDWMVPHMSSIHWCQCGSNICNINGNIVQNVGSAEYLQQVKNNCGYLYFRSQYKCVALGIVGEIIHRPDEDGHHGNHEDQQQGADDDACVYIMHSLSKTY